MGKKVPGKEECVRDDGWDDGACDHRSDEKRVLRLGNDVVIQAEQCRDRAKGQPRRHHQRVIGSRGAVISMSANRRVHGNSFRRRLRQEETRTNQRE